MVVVCGALAFLGGDKENETQEVSEGKYATETKCIYWCHLLRSERKDNFSSLISRSEYYLEVFYLLGPESMITKPFNAVMIIQWETRSLTTERYPSSRFRQYSSHAEEIASLYSNIRQFDSRMEPVPLKRWLGGCSPRRRAAIDSQDALHRSAMVVIKNSELKLPRCSLAAASIRHPWLIFTFCAEKF